MDPSLQLGEIQGQSERQLIRILDQCDEAWSIFINYIATRITCLENSFSASFSDGLSLPLSFGTRSSVAPFQRVPFVLLLLSFVFVETQLMHQAVVFLTLHVLSQPR